MSIIEESFEEFILKGQEILKDTKINNFLMMIIKAHFIHKNDYETLDRNLMEILNNSRLDSVTKWNSIYKELIISEKSEKINKRPGAKYTTTELCLKEIKLNILYPRLDINVSKHINHLLKAPFCVHPKTGLISVPMSENDIINFNLDKIPSITDSIDDFMANK